MYAYDTLAYASLQAKPSVPINAHQTCGDANHRSTCKLLHKKATNGALAGYDPADLDDTLVDISEKLGQLPQLHSDLWEVFKSVRNQRDQEAYERLLADEELRSRFYERLTAFARTLGPAHLRPGCLRQGRGRGHHACRSGRHHRLRH